LKNTDYKEFNKKRFKKNSGNRIFDNWFEKEYFINYFEYNNENYDLLIKLSNIYEENNNVFFYERDTDIICFSNNRSLKTSIDLKKSKDFRVSNLYDLINKYKNSKFSNNINVEIITNKSKKEFIVNNIFSNFYNFGYIFYIKNREEFIKAINTLNTISIKDKSIIILDFTLDQNSLILLRKVIDYKKNNNIFLISFKDNLINYTEYFKDFDLIKNKINLNIKNNSELSENQINQIDSFDLFKFRDVILKISSLSYKNIPILEDILRFLLFFEKTDLAERLIKHIKDKEVKKIYISWISFYKKNYKDGLELINNVKDFKNNNYKDMINFLKKLFYLKIERKSINKIKIKDEFFRNIVELIRIDSDFYSLEDDELKDKISELESYFKAKNNVYYYIYAESIKARYLRKLNRFKESEELYVDLIIKSDLYDFKILKANILLDYGNLQLRLNNFKDAETNYKSALNIFKDYGIKKSQILAESNLAEIYKFYGNWRETERLLKSVLNYDLKINSKPLFAIDYFNLGYIEYLKFNFDLANKYIKLSRNYFKELNNSSAVIECDILLLKIRIFTKSKIKKSEFNNNSDDIRFNILLRLISYEEIPLELIRKIMADDERFDMLRILYYKFKKDDYLDEMRKIAEKFPKDEISYFYFEYLYVYFDVKDIDKVEKDKINEFLDMFYFFYKNNRKFSDRIYNLKKEIEKGERDINLFDNISYINKFAKWEIFEDFFDDFKKDIGLILNYEYMAIRIYKNNELLFKNPINTDFNDVIEELFEIFSRNLTIQAFEKDFIDNNLKTNSKHFYEFLLTKIFLWKISENLYAFVLLAFNDISFRNVDLLARINDVLSKYKSLVKRFYEENYEIKNRLNFIVGESDVIKELKNQISKISRVDFSVLIQGESGTGKELVAKAIHLLSNRANKPFVTINSAAIPDNLLESEMFGFERGAFTDASRSRVGLIEEANGGTLFLDEIGDLSLNLQAKLLRVLQEREIRRIGENTVRKVDIRLISATNKNLEKMIEKGEFREDLYYRIKELTINVPSLKERIEDIPQLTRYFFNKYGFVNIDDNYLNNLILDFMTREWKGNVRELEAEIKKFITFYPDLEFSQLKDKKFDLRYFKDKTELFILKNLMKKHNGNKTKMADELGITRTAVYKLLKKHGLK